MLSRNLTFSKFGFVDTVSCQILQHKYLRTITWHLQRKLEVLDWFYWSERSKKRFQAVFSIGNIAFKRNWISNLFPCYCIWCYKICFLYWGCAMIVLYVIILKLFLLVIIFIACILFLKINFSLFELCVCPRPSKFWRPPQI